MRETLKGIINAGILSAAAAGLAGCTYAEGCAIMAQGERNNIERERNAILAHQGPQVVYVEPQRPEWPNSIVCNDLRDFDGSGGMTYPDEIVGMKNVFTTKENIKFVRGPKGSGNYTFKVFDGAGNLLWTYKDRDKEEGECTMLAYKPGELKPGTYLGVWYNGDKAEGSSQIRVVSE